MEVINLYILSLDANNVMIFDTAEAGTKPDKNEDEKAYFGIIW